MHIKKLISFLFGYGILLLTILISPSLPAHAIDPLIQCGRMGAAEICNICDLVLLVQGLVTKAVTYFASPIAALMLGYGGFVMVIAGVRGGNQAMYGKGKKVLTNTLIGIVILLCSWLLIDTILKGIGYSESNFGPWNKIECESEKITVPSYAVCRGNTCERVSGATSAGCTIGSAQSNCGSGAKHLGCDAATRLCKWIDGEGPNGCTEGSDPRCAAPATHKECSGAACIDMPGAGPNRCASSAECGVAGNEYERNLANARELEGIIEFTSASPDCDGKSAATNFQEMLNSQSLTVCHAGCRTDRLPCTRQGFTAKPQMIDDLKTMAVDYGLSFRVNSIATGQHSSGSDHYQGRGVDLLSGGSSYVELERRLIALRTAGSPIRLIQCEDSSSSVVSCSSSSSRHLHVSYY